MCVVQAMRPGRVDYVGAKVPAGSFGHMLGNSMSVNVLERLLPRVLVASGLLNKLPKDKWAKHGRDASWVRRRLGKREAGSGSDC